MKRLVVLLCLIALGILFCISIAHNSGTLFGYVDEMGIEE